MESSLHAQASTGTASADLAGFFGALVRTETRLYTELNDRMRRAHDLYASQYEFLRFLRDHPHCRVVDIAAHFAIGVGATSKGMDRLEARGWLLRERSETDRRAVLLTLTPAGAQLVDEAEPTFDALLTERVASVLTAEQVHAVAASLTVLRDVLERAGVGTPIG